MMTVMAMMMPIAIATASIVIAMITMGRILAPLNCRQRSAEVHIKMDNRQAYYR